MEMMHGVLQLTASWGKKQVASNPWGPTKGHETNFSPISYK